MLQRHPDQMTDDELETWVRLLIEHAEPENVRIDYKEIVSLSSPTERREAAKDITSFANEVGGTLVYGVPEDRTNSNAPVPKRPYGMDPRPGLAQRLEDIYAGVVTPLLPEYRIREVPISEYPGKVCYVVWTPESWTGPHMVQGYGDARYYRRGQYRALPMTEGDVAERYRRRLSMQSAAEEFLKSDDTRHALPSFDRKRPRTTLVVVPYLLVPNRIAFHQVHVREWLQTKRTAGPWLPSMRGVRHSSGDERYDKVFTEVHNNAAFVAHHYTATNNEGEGDVHIVAYLDELQILLGQLQFTSSLYEFVGYTGPLLIELTVQPGQKTDTPPSLPTRYLPILLPAGRFKGEWGKSDSIDVKIRVEASGVQIAKEPDSVLHELADGLFRAFGFWQADCFDQYHQLRRPR